MQTLRSIDADEGSDSRVLLSIYSFNPDKKRWVRTPYQRIADSPPPSSIQILTWNVDFAGSQTSDRLQCALEHIQGTIFRCTNGQAPPPCIVLLQEIEAEVIATLFENSWVRKNFQATPISGWNWPNHAHYGNITLVARSIPVMSASSLVFTNSHMARNALMVDLQLSTPKQNPDADELVETASQDRSLDKVVFRVANVHLESLPQGAKARPEQLALVTQALTEPGIYGGVVCGDMNSILETDKDTPKEVGLLDAYTGADDDAKGHTWGYQPVSAYRPGRLDKILYTPGTGFTVDNLQRVGVSLRTTRDLWVSDHYGLLASLTLRSNEEETCHH